MNAKVWGAEGRRARRGGAGEKPREARGFEDLRAAVVIVLPFVCLFIGLGWNCGTYE